MDKELIATNYMETQRVSRTAYKGMNFVCPICGIKRVAKLRVAKDDWYHTGCNCTQEFLKMTGQWLDCYSE